LPFTGPVVFFGVLPRAVILGFSAILVLNHLWAGGSGLNVIVVVNQASTNSLQLGNDYCEQRGVPPQNVLRLTNWTGGSINWSPAEFQNDLQQPLLALVASRGLTNQAQFVLLSMDIPYRVTDGVNENSTTAALFYGFKTNGEPVEGIPSCSLPDNTSNSYAYSELPFDRAAPNTACTNSFLAMMLTDVDLAHAETTLARALAAEGSGPTQAVYLAKTTDEARSSRFVLFDNAVFENRVVGDYAVQRISGDSMDFTNLFGLQAGLDIYSLNANTFVPGALGDSLTSFAGYILDPTAQTTALAFLEAGASGSYGTIVEPCSYTQKFPDPVDYFYQTRGFSLAEAYYQSVLNPFQGIFVGEPLAAPFARPGTAAWLALTDGAVLSHEVVLTPDFAAAATNLPLAQVDLFVDGTFYQTMTNLLPAPGNVLSVVLNGNNINYPVPATNTLAAVAAGLAGALNAESSLTHVQAFPEGDRVELQSLDVFVPGSNVTVSAGASAGSAPALTTGLNAARSTFLDTIATGYHVATFYNTPQPGDWLAVTFTKTNGTTVDLAVTNTVAGATIGDLAQSLFDEIQTNAALRSADGVNASDFYDADPGEAAAEFYVYANTSGWPAAQLLTDWSSSSNLIIAPAGLSPLSDNVSDLRPRNHLYVTSGLNSLAVNFPWDTTRRADGYHQLTAVAYEGSSVATQTRITRNVVVNNTGLTAALASDPADNHATLAQSLQFTITANETNISKIELFGTGGSLGMVPSRATAVFTVSAAYLGLGLHPFYAIVTDHLGNQYRTPTVSYRLVAPIPLALSGGGTFSWPVIAGLNYELQFTTNLAAGFATLVALTASNSPAQWPIGTTNAAGFYRVKLDE